jgi:hypothetical protein
MRMRVDQAGDRQQTSSIDSTRCGVLRLLSLWLFKANAADLIALNENILPLPYTERGFCIKDGAVFD